MTDFNAPDVRVREIRKGPLVAKGAGSTIGGFLGICSRGPVNTPTLVSSFQEAVSYFGTFRTDSEMMYAVKAFFENGGKYCYICRVTGSGAAAAAISSANGTGAIIDWDASFVGILANGWTITTTRKAITVSEVPAGASLGTGAITSLVLTSVSRIRIGDLFRVRSTNGSEPDTLTSTATGVNTSTNTVAFASTAPQNPAGAPSAGGITVASPTDAVVDILVFDVVLRDVDGSILYEWKNLRMSSLSANYYATVINQTFRTPLVAAANGAGAAASDPRPTDGTVTLAAGADPTITDASYIGGGTGSGTGLNAFDGTPEMDMLSIPGVFGTSQAVAKAHLDHADLLGTYVAIPEIPVGTSVANAIVHASTNVNRYTTFAEGYWYPNLYILDPVTGEKVLVGPTGARQGCIVRTHRARGSAKAAAGTVDGRILGVVGVERTVSKTEYDLLYPARINAIKSVTGAGICFMGNITLDPDESVIESSVRFYLLKTRKTLQNGLQWIAFELNNKATRARATRYIGSLLREDWRNGLLNGDQESDAYFVVCDETNNGPEVQAARKLNIRVGVNVTHTAEFVDITLELDTRALDASLAQQG